MTRDISCPVCHEQEHLSGSRGEGGIRIHCANCGAEWDRDQSLHCATCDGTDIVTRPQTLTATSRGSQLSILGWRELPMCVDCDLDELRRSTDAEAPLAPDYRPAAMERREADQGHRT